MEENLSRSELKRRAKSTEALAKELSELASEQLKKLPCDAELQEEIRLAQTLKSGARKRQLKHISKELRKIDPSELLDFLAAKKGSKLKKNMVFHELERLRDAIIQEAFDAKSIDAENETSQNPEWLSTSVQEAGERFPVGGLDLNSLQQSALRFVRSRKPVYKREIFRALQAAQERQKYRES